MLGLKLNHVSKRGALVCPGLQQPWHWCWSIHRSLITFHDGKYHSVSKYVNPLHAKFFRGNINIYLHFVSFLHIYTTQVVEILPQVRQELHSQYHGCWCPGNVRSQGISSHDIDLFKPRWLSPHTLRVTKCKWVRSGRCSCRVTWFCYRLIAKSGNKKNIHTLWPDPNTFYVSINEIPHIEA